MENLRKLQKDLLVSINGVIQYSKTNYFLLLKAEGDLIIDEKLESLLLEWINGNDSKTPEIQSTLDKIDTCTACEIGNAALEAKKHEIRMSESFKQGLKNG